jgi:uncharacterized protein YraI
MIYADTRGGAHAASAGRRFGLLAVGVLVVLAFAAPAVAQPVRIVWSTYLRTGPGSGYAVVDEIQHDTLVDLRTCGAHWCQILSGRTVGYVDRDSIKLPANTLGERPRRLGFARPSRGGDTSVPLIPAVGQDERAKMIGAMTC